MEFELSAAQQAREDRAGQLGRDLADDAPAASVVAHAARLGLIDPQVDLLSAAAATAALAAESAGAALTYAVHTSVVLAGAGDAHTGSASRGEQVGAVGLSSDDLADTNEDRLTGRASWVGPLTDRGVVIVGARTAAGARVACLVPLEAPGVVIEPIGTDALPGFACGHVSFSDVPCTPLGSPLPIMTRIRVLLAAAALGMGRRALREALVAARAHRHHGAGGEQTVQGLLADAATELDAALLLTWKAASAPSPSLAEASLAKLAASEAAQRSVARATQVIGVETLRRGHRVERLARDVRALELFAGRTEALRDAAAEALLPTVTATAT